MARTCIDKDWRVRPVRNPFGANVEGVPQGADIPAYPDEDWRRIDVPHDMSIESRIGQEPPLAGANPNNGYHAWLPGNLLWYRKHLTITNTRGRIFLLEFGGSYRNTDVWVNGHHAGNEPNGYFTFTFDITRFVQEGENIIAVRVNNLDTPNCRWYTGTGIYRHVWLWDCDETHIAHRGVCVTTPEVHEKEAVVRVATEIEGKGRVRLASRIVDADGTIVAETGGEFGCGQTALQEIRVLNPKRWHVDSPSMYTLVSVLSRDNKTIDEQRTPFGIRSIEYRKRKGFFLNGTSMKMKGVCLHHDAGPLGAAVPESVWAYRLAELKKIGCNAIRTSHNPPAEEFLGLCDTMGFLVMDELCDKWEPPHYLDFDRRWENDITSWIRRDRNHPSIVLWSVGNENDGPGTLYLEKRLPMLCNKVRSIDTTRPVIAALERGPDGVNRAALVRRSAAHMDLIGVNYGEQWYDEMFTQDPDALIVGTENYTYFSSLPEKREAMLEKNPWLYAAADERVIGLFYWVGIDYLGEAYRAWPRIGSSSGLFDMTGHPKPRAALIESFWSERPTVTIIAVNEEPKPASMWSFPAVDRSWDRPDGGAVKLAVYSNCESVELSLNGKSIGRKRMSDHPNRIMSWEVPFEKGALTAIGYNGASEAARCILMTPLKPVAIRLSALCDRLSADGRDIGLVEAQLVDENGTHCRDSGTITFAVNGNASIACVGNGDLTWHGPFNADNLPLFRGRAVVYVRTGNTGGTVSIAARSGGLAASIEMVIG
ncbi:MAG: glycoside hydrolase family 2 protein [Spirochaetes bacterium]|nr:glycoside hydrolase family 2 protein [Spirochaetota bacterium]